jgi:hypothetical protein
MLAMWQTESPTGVRFIRMDRNLVIRFISKIAQPQCENGCWEWTGAIRGKCGYGAIKVSGRTESAHVLSHRLYNGDVPAGMDVMHSCDNRKCVNPNHLSVGTRSENMIDAAHKGRLNRGRDPNVEYTAEVVRLAVEMVRRGETLRSAASSLGVAHSTVRRWILRRTRSNAHQSK